MQSIIKDFMNGVVSAYMTEVNKKNISGSITKKNLDISELEIFPDALLQHGVPLLVKKGTIKNISIQIPIKFKTEPVKITIDSVTILGSLCTHNPTREQIIDMKIHMINAYHFFRKRFKMLLGIMPKQSFLSIIRTIFSNIILDINHIHVQIEYPTGSIDTFDESNLDFSSSKFSLSKSSQRFSSSRQSDMKSSTQSMKEVDEEEETETQTIEEKSDNVDQEDSDTGSKSMNDNSNNSDDNDFLEESLDELSDSIDETTDQEPYTRRMSIYKNYGTVYCGSDDAKSGQTQRSKVTSIGITINKLLLHNPASIDNPSPYKITKEAVFTDLAIYMDVDQPSVDTSSNEKCEKELTDLYNSTKHNYILEPFSFSGLMKFEKGNPQLFFEPFIKTVMANIREEYIPAILELMKGVGTFQKKFAVAQIPKPSIDDPEAFWVYLHRCAVTKISTPTFDFSKNLNLLLKRMVYLKNYKKSDPKSKAIIKEMEETLDYSTIVAFRAAYLLAYKKRSGKTALITPLMTSKIKKIAMVDPVYIVTKLVRMMAMNFTGDSVSIALLRNTGEKHIVIDVKKPRFKFEKDLKDYIIHAVVSYVSIKHIKETEKVVFKSLDSNSIEMKANVKIPFLSYMNWSLSLEMTKNNYSLNLPGLLQLVTDLGLIELVRSSQSASKQKRNFELNVQIRSSALRIVGSQNNRAVQIAFDKLALQTDPTTLAQSFKLENSWISLIADNEAKVSSDFSLSGSIKGKDISLSIPLFSCAIPFNYIVVIDDFIHLVMGYRGLFRDAAFPKPDFNFKLDMKGLNVNIKIPNSNERVNLQIRNILFTLEKSKIKFLLSLVEMSKLFSLKNLSVTFDQASLKLKIAYIYAKVFMLLSLIPKDAFQMLQNSRKNDEIKSENSDASVKDYSEADDDSEESPPKPSTSLELPNIKISCGIEESDIDLALTSTERFNLNVKNIKAKVNKNLIKAGAMLNQWAFQNQTIAQQISFNAEILISKAFEIKIIVDNCNINLSKSLINYLLNVNMSSYEVAFPHELALKVSFVLNQMSISNDFVMKNFLADINLSNSKFDVSVGLDSVNSSFLKFVSKDVVKMKMDIEQKSLDLVVNLEDMTIFVIPLCDLISKLPAFIPSTPQIKLNLTLKPLLCNCVFGEDYLNINFNSPLTLKLDTMKGPIPYVDLDMSNFTIYLNNKEIIRLNSLKFSLTNKLIAEIPELYIKLSMLKIYKLLKMLTTIPIKKLMSSSQSSINLYEMPIESIVCKIPYIEVMMHQIKSRRSVLFILDDSEVNIKNTDKKTDLIASTTVHLNASDGFQTFSLAPEFRITCNGEFTETHNNCVLESPDPIKIEFSTHLLNQIIKNLTANEDTVEQPYAISNETGADVTIIVKGEEHLIESDEFLPNVHNFSQSDIKIKIGEIVNPIKIDSLASAISYPLFFGENHILVWMDTRKLQIRLLSPISLFNKSRTDLEIKYLDNEITLDDGETISLNYKIERLESIFVKTDDDDYTEINLNEQHVIKVDEKYVVVTRKRKEDSLHTTIEFTTPYYMKNELITDINVIVKNNQITLKPCENVPFPYFPPKSDCISFDIQDTTEIKGVHVDLQMNEWNDNKIFIPTADKEGKPFIIQFTLTNEKRISISSLIIFYNSISLPLVFGLSAKEKIMNVEKCYLNQMIPSFFPFQNTQTIWKRDNPIMVSPADTNSKKINVYIRTIYSTKWSEKPISMSNFNKLEDLMIPFDENKVCLAHFHVLSHSLQRPNTFIFFILPKFVINNLTNKTFSVNLFDGEGIEMPPNSCIPVTIIRNSYEFSIAVVQQQQQKSSAAASPKKKRTSSSSSSLTSSSSKRKRSEVFLPKKYLVYSHKVNLLKLTSQFIKVNSVESPVLLQLSTENEINFITILLNRTLPYLFVNKSKSKVIFIQKNTRDFAHTVMPNESLPFFIFDENMPTIIHCEIGNQIKFELDVNEPCFPLRINTNDDSHYHSHQKYYYYVDLSVTEGSTITLCNVDEDEIAVSRSSSSLNSSIASSHSNLNLAESASSFNLYDLLHSSQTETDFKFNFSFLSVLLITRNYKELLRLTLKDVAVNSAIRQRSVKNEITVGTIKVDDQDPYAIYPSVFQILSSNDKPAVVFKFESFGSYKYGGMEIQLQPITVRVDLSFVADVIGSLLYSENLIMHEHEVEKNSSVPEFTISEVSLSEFINNFMPKNKKYHINHIAIHPFTVRVSFKTATTRSDHPLQNSYHFNRLIELIPSLNDISISIEDKYVFRNLSGTTADIVLKIGNDIKKIILTQLSLRNIIHESSNYVVKTAKSIVNIRSRDASSPSLLRKTGSVLSVAEMALCHISSMLDVYTNQPPNIRTDETSLGALSWGVKSLCKSVGKGVDVLINEPKRRGNVNGKVNYCGYIEGAGVGIAKAAAFGMSGVCNFSASILSSTKRIFFTEKVSSIDRRELDPVLGMHAGEGEKLLWFNGSVSSNLIEVYTRSVYSLESQSLIKSVVNAEIDKENNSVTLTDDGQKKHVFNFEDITQAMPFYNIIQSQLLRKKIFGNSDNQLS
ncbi:hypothetical protein M9Y10_020220 [Tritrichomonas musculus]|uniref:Chorein N-terminal domain-containing protein n=1 Tax=Tritrichomonas musculus TaxID=1915356 RepID=A0ABR2HFJ9_9EUKA